MYRHAIKMIVPLLLCAFAAASQGRLVVHGTVDSLVRGDVYVFADDDLVAVAEIVDGKFFIECDVPDTQVAFFAIDGIDDTLPFFPEAVEFTATLKTGLPELNKFAPDSHIEGGGKQALYNEWNGQSHDRETLRTWISANSTSDVASYVVFVRDPAMFGLLAPEQQQSPLGKHVAAKLEEENNRNRLFPTYIPLELPNGKTITIGDIDAKTKNILFWSKDSEKFLPDIKLMRSTYNRYYSNGGEIVWIFIGSREEWQDALKKYNMPWINVLDNSAQPLERVLNLAIAELPYQYMLDADNTVTLERYSLKVNTIKDLKDRLILTQESI